MYHSRIKAHRIPRALGAIGAIVWIGYVLYTLTNDTTSYAHALFAGIAGAALLLYACNGPSKLSARSGKALVLIGVASLLMLVLNDGWDVSASDVLVRIGVLASGLFLERINPHQRFAPWMFLALATKIEFFLVGALVSALSSIEVFDITLGALWWIVPCSMALAVPALAFSVRAVYRSLVLFTSGIALALTILTTMHSELSLVAALLLACIILNPLIAERAVGYVTFYRKE